MKHTFLTKEEARKYYNYLVVWVDQGGLKHIEEYHTRKQAENSDSYIDNYLAQVFTRRQYESSDESLR